MTCGLITMMLIIVLTDQLLWRPLIAWSDKFKFENVESADRVTSPMLHLLRNSNVLGIIQRHTLMPLAERYLPDAWHSGGSARTALAGGGRSSRRGTWLSTVVVGAAADCRCGFAAFHALLLLKQIHGHEFLSLLAGAAATFLRVNASLLLASAWTIPVGVAIGFNPRLAHITQPLAQIAASFPATALFPVILVALMRLGLGLGIGSIALMLLGTQWYILFNVIAGAMAIPSDLREVSRTSFTSRACSAGRR